MFTLFEQIKNENCLNTMIRNHYNFKLIPLSKEWCKNLKYVIGTKYYDVIYVEMYFVNVARYTHV